MNTNPYNGPSMPMPKTTRADIDVMHAWGIKLNEWQRLPEHKRAEYRANVAQVTKIAQEIEVPRLDTAVLAVKPDWNF